MPAKLAAVSARESKSACPRVSVRRCANWGPVGSPRSCLRRRSQIEALDGLRPCSRPALESPKSCVDAGCAMPSRTSQRGTRIVV